MLLKCGFEFGNKFYNLFLYTHKIYLFWARVVVEN